MAVLSDSASSPLCEQNGPQDVISESSKMTIEELLDDIGGFGRFQVIIIVTLFVHKIFIGWSMLQMSYSGFIPDWHCGTVASSHYGNETIIPNNDTTKEMCDVNYTLTNYRELSCDHFQFDTSYVTITTEWNLLCDRKYIKSLLTSIQMSGVLVGCFISGQLADVIGRKKTLYGFCLFHALLNIGTAFSVNWEMFAVGLFLIGNGIGGITVVQFSYLIEFQPVKWRPLLSALPVWQMGTAFLALFGLVLKNWSHLHLACGIIALPTLVGYFYVPESMRWLTVQGRLDEAEDVCRKMASVNGKPLPAKARPILEKIYQDELDSRKNDKRYSYIDIFKGRSTLHITATLCYFWFSMSTIFYGVSFGVGSLAGNLFLNIFLMGVIEVPAMIGQFYLVNKFGRKATAVGLFSISFMASIGIIVVHFCAPTDLNGGLTTGLSLLIKMGVGAGWAVIATWGAELYPTVTRNLGIGLANTAARVGGIVVPFILDFENKKALSYSIIAVLVLLIVVLALLLQETKGRVLEDSLQMPAITITITDSQLPSNGDLKSTKCPPGESSVTDDTSDTGIWM